MNKKYEKIQELLKEQEEFPLRYLHKFIGKNTPEFNRAVETLEAQFPKLERQAARTSQGDAHVALTYVLEAGSAEEVILLFEATEKIPDIVIVL